MDELGVQLIFARSPQAKGRVERMAGTFQDRLVTELRLAEAATIDDANRVLADFLPRFNQRFRVPPQHSETYRVLDPQMCLDTTLCLKYRRRVGRDNTVKYRWRTLNYDGMDRPSYAGAVVDVLDWTDSGSAARGADDPHTEAPQRPNTCATSPAPSHTGNGRRWVDKLAQLGPCTSRHCRRQRRWEGSQRCDSSPAEAHTTSDGGRCGLAKGLVIARSYAAREEV